MFGKMVILSVIAGDVVMQVNNFTMEVLLSSGLSWSKESG